MTPDSIPDERIDYHFERTLRRRGADALDRFRRLINAMDMVWREDWLARAKAREEEEKRKREIERSR